MTQTGAKTSTTYGPDRKYRVSVVDFVSELNPPELQVFDLPLDGGLTLVRRCDVTVRGAVPEG